MMEWFKKHLIWALPIFLIVIYLVYRAVWTLAALSRCPYFWNQHNIEFATFMSKDEITGRLGENPKYTSPWMRYFVAWGWHGLIRVWALPYILLSPGFYRGLFEQQNHIWEFEK